MSPGKKSLVAVNISIMVGLFNTSPLRCLFVYTPDGATHWKETDKETGWSKSVISYANALGIPVVNVANTQASFDLIEQLTKTANFKQQ